MAKPNYSFAKRQRDLAKKQKKEDKQRRKSEGASDNPSQDDQLQEVSPQTTDEEKPAD
jgi:hypothetical protein